MKRLVSYSCAALLAITACSANAVTIYQHDFTGDVSTALDGVGVEGGTGVGTPWTAEAAWSADGSVVVGVDEFDNANAFLPFSPAPGKVYTLSATLTATGDTFNFMTLAFMNNPTVDTLSTETGGPWMFKRAQQDGFVDEVYSATDNLNGLVNHNAFAGAVDLAMVLDTKAPQWSVEFLVNGSSVRGPVTLASNPVITHVGVTRYVAPVVGTVDSFSLTEVPEPGVALLAFVGLLVTRSLGYRQRG